MSNCKGIAAEIHYEIRLVSGPASFTLRDVDFTIKSGSDIVVLARLTVHGRDVVDTRIVGVIGDDFASGTREMIAISRFFAGGGVIGLSQELRV
jgi:hypothetical protein